MIVDVRERIFKSNMFKIIVWGLVLVLGGFLTIPTFFQDMSNDVWIVRINDVKIGEREFRRKLKFWQEQIYAFKKQYGAYADMFLQSMGLSVEPSALALDTIVRNELISQEAARLHLPLHDAYVAEKLSDSNFIQQVFPDLIPVHVLDPVQGINESLLHSYLREIDLPATHFEAHVQQALQRYFYIELMMGSEYIPSFEIKERYLADKVGRKYTILTFKYADYLKREKEIAPSAQDLEQFFQTQSKTLKRYWVPEKRVGISWKFSPDDYGITVTDQEIDDYYDIHKTSKFIERKSQVEVRAIVFEIPDREHEGTVRKQAEEVRKELVENPGSFAQKAREISADKETASKGGLMPTFSKGVHEQDFEKTAFLLKKDGDVSSVIRTKRGFEIVQRVRKDPIVYKSLESVKSSIVSALLKQKFSQRFVKDIERLIQNPESIESFIASKKAKKTANPALAKDGSKLAAELFDLKEKEYGLYVEGDTGVMVQLVEIQKRYLPTLDSIKDLVTNDLQEERAVQALQRDLDQARSEVATKSFKDLQSQFDAYLETTPFVSKSDSRSLKSLKDRGLPVENLFQLEKVGMITQSMDNRNGHLIRLEEVSPFNEADFQNQIARIHQQVLGELRQLWSQSYVASLYRSATINVNENRLKQQ